MMSQKIAVVTGSSSGMGFETSLTLARNGFHTYARMRKLESGGSNQIVDIATRYQNDSRGEIHE
jgi:NAD(P)-dependent dehydrogenase (short-subunit alcohol dehydrogenase family)